MKISVSLSAQSSGTHVAVTTDSYFELQSIKGCSKKANHSKGWDAKLLA
jgi:hypothetical protein